MQRTMLVALLGASLVAGCRLDRTDRSAESSVPQTERMARFPVIPRRVLFGEPDRVRPQLSPDGRRLAFLARHDGALNVWVGPARDPRAARPVTADPEPIHRFWWAYTGDHILYLQDRRGDENDHLFAVTLSTGETRDLTPMDGVKAKLQALSPHRPDQALVLLNDREPSEHDLHQVELVTGERRRVARSEGFAGFTADEELRVRLASRYAPDGTVELLRRTGAGGWERWTSIPAADNLTTGPIGFDRAGRRLFMQESRGRNTGAVVEVEWETGAARTLAEDPRADAGYTLRHPTEGHVQAVAFTYARREWKVVDPAIARDFEALRRLGEGELEVMSRSVDDRRWVVARVRSDGPVEYHLWDRDAGEARLLFVNREGLRDYELAPMRPEILRSRDGLELVSYLTLPLGSDPDRDGRPEEPLPMALVVHGGPWARDYWGLDNLHQLLANRGYAVLSVNYRGSSGLGKEFLNAGNLEWGGRMHDDLVDGVRWAMESGIADPARVAIVGGSYGGYAALVGLTLTPELFAAGVDIVGPSNLMTLLASVPPYWAPIRSIFHTRVGDPTTAEGRALLKTRSPLTHVDSIRRPLLIAQGANDPRVKQAESDQIAGAMKERGIPVTYVLFPDEGHGFARHENSLAFWAVTEGFLARHLGGRREPLRPADFEGSSIEVREGAGGVPGLAEALAGRGVEATAGAVPAGRGVEAAAGAPPAGRSTR